MVVVWWECGWASGDGLDASACLFCLLSFSVCFPFSSFPFFGLQALSSSHFSGDFVSGLPSLMLPLSSMADP